MEGRWISGVVEDGMHAREAREEIRGSQFMRVRVGILHGGKLFYVKHRHIIS